VPISQSHKGGAFPNFTSQKQLLALHSKKEAHSQSELNGIITPVHLNKLLASPESFTCSEKGCEYSGFTEADFQQHQLSAHIRFVCILCSDAFESAKTLHVHVDQHKSTDGYSIRCLKSGCQSLVSSARALSRHLIAKHDEKVRTEISPANKVFKIKQLLNVN
jgi:hypothetical protein